MFKNTGSFSFDQSDKILESLSQLEMIASRATSLLSKLKNESIVNQILSSPLTEAHLSTVKERKLASNFFVASNRAHEDIEDESNIKLSLPEPDVKEYILRNNVSRPEGSLKLPNRMFATVGDSEFSIAFAVSSESE